MSVQLGVPATKRSSQIEMRQWDDAIEYSRRLTRLHEVGIREPIEVRIRLI